MLKNLIKEYKPELLEDVAEVGRLADKYLSTKIIPEKYRADALHIAFATFYEMDVLVSYNLRHIVKLKTRRLANYINLLEGYKTLEIGTPEEVIDYEWVRFYTRRYPQNTGGALRRHKKNGCQGGSHIL